MQLNHLEQIYSWKNKKKRFGLVKSRLKKYQRYPNKTHLKNVGKWKDVVPLNFNKVEWYHNKFLPKHTIQLEKGYFSGSIKN